MTSATSSRISAVSPLWAVEGGRVTISGSGLRRRSRAAARSASASARRAWRSPRPRLADRRSFPPGLDGGHTPVRVDEAPGETAYVEIGAPLATGLHQVDNPAFDRARQPLRDLQRIARAAGAGLDLRRPSGRHARAVRRPTWPIRRRWRSTRDGRLHVSSRFDGSVHRVDADGTVDDRRDRSRRRLRHRVRSATARCSSAIDRDRSCACATGARRCSRRIPPSVAAFHLAFGPDGWLYVTAPTLGARDSVYRVSPEGAVEVFHDGFGRPQGLAFDAHGHLYVVDALAGASGVYRLRADRPARPSRCVAGGALIGLAFDPRGGLVLASSDTVYRLDAATLRGLLDRSRNRLIRPTTPARGYASPSTSTTAVTAMPTVQTKTDRRAAARQASTR